MLRTWVFQFESSEDLPLPEPPASCLAALGTHDLPRFAAYLWAEDVTERQQRGVLTPDEASAEQAARRAWRRRLLRALGVSEDRDVAAITAAALEGCLTHLARSDAAITLVDLEDLWGERAQQNVPGTGPEAENWRLARRPYPRGAPRRRPPGRRPRRAGEGAGRMTTLRPGPAADAQRGGSPLVQRGHSSEARTEAGFASRARRRNQLRRLGAERATRERRRRLQLVGRGRATPWRPGASRGSGRERFPRRARARCTSSPSRRSRERSSTRPTRSPRCTEVPPRTGSVIWDLSYEWGDGDWMASRGRRARARRAHLDLRGPSRKLATGSCGPRTVPPLRRVGRPAHRARPALRVHPCRVPALDGTSVLRILGLSDDRLLRADPPLRGPAGPHDADRPPPPRRHRR